MSMRCIPDAVRFTGIQTRSHISSVCCNVFMNISRFLSDLFHTVVSCFAAMEIWTGCLLPGFIKPSADRYIFKNEMGKAETARVPVRGQLQMSGYSGFREDARLLLHQRVRD